MIPATAIIHTRNSERYLAEVIDCLGDFDEVLVCDMESSDRTLDIARGKGCTVVSFPPVGYVEPARSFAMSQARNDWVFFVDSDETVTTALAEYVACFIENPPVGAAALRVPRRNMLLGRWVRSTWPDFQTRLLDRRKCAWPSFIHSRPVVDGVTVDAPLSGAGTCLVHKAPSLSEVMERADRYTDREVERRRRAGHRPGIASMICRPGWYFIRSYILRGGFLCGIPGLVEACNKAYYKFYTLAKLYEKDISDRSE